MSESRYGLFTAISMVVGIVVGSGIFFKADDILLMSGSIVVGVLGFLFVGVGVICGSVVMSQYALVDSSRGGLVSYARVAFGERFSLITAWLLLSVYFPAIGAILVRVTAIYTVMLFGWDEMFILPLSLFYLFSSVVINYVSPILAGRVQVITTLCKLLPLVVIGLVGVMFNYDQDVVVTSYVSDVDFFTCLLAIAFSFDGWIVATSISGELKNMKRNLPLALVSGTLIITVIYIVYFVGISLFLGPEVIISLGDMHLGVVANKLLGSVGEKVILLFVVISAFGGLNGMVLAYLRVPKNISDNALFVDKLGFKKVSGVVGASLSGLIVCVSFLLFYVLVDNLSIRFFTSFDVSALPMIGVYLVYVVLYVGVVKLFRKNDVSRLYYVLLVIAMLVSLIILIGSITGDGFMYLLVTFLMFLLLPFFVNLRVFK